MCHMTYEYVINLEFLIKSNSTWLKLEFVNPGSNGFKHGCSPSTWILFSHVKSRDHSNYPNLRINDNEYPNDK